MRGALCWLSVELHAGILKADQVLSGSQLLPSLSEEYSATYMSFGAWKAYLKSDL